MGHAHTDRIGRHFSILPLFFLSFAVDTTLKQCTSSYGDNTVVNIAFAFLTYINNPENKEHLSSCHLLYSSIQL